MIDSSSLRVRIEPMQIDDIGQILEIERASFSAPWSARAYDYELRYNELAHYFIARPQAAPVADPRSARGRLNWLSGILHPEPAPAPDHTPSILGYVGFWLMAGEAHISTIAVRPEFRGHSIGELLLVNAIDRAMELGAQVATLEVRVSNVKAQNLYSKYSFENVGLRKGYYTDNNEDAIIMTTPSLNSVEYQRQFSGLKKALMARLRVENP